jgi:hypothetical protein
MTARPEDPVLRSARREALVVLLTWVCALTYTVGYCSLHAYSPSAPRTKDATVTGMEATQPPPRELAFVHLFWGIAFPDWVFWGIVVPWGVCFCVSWWFSYVYMTDADLGPELEETDELPGATTGGNDA